MVSIHFGGTQGEDRHGQRVTSLSWSIGRANTAVSLAKPQSLSNELLCTATSGLQQLPMPVGVPLMAAATKQVEHTFQQLPTSLVLPDGPNITSLSHRKLRPTSTRNYSGLHSLVKHSLGNVRALVLRWAVTLRRRVVAGNAASTEGELAVHENVMGHSDGARGEEE